MTDREELVRLADCCNRQNVNDVADTIKLLQACASAMREAASALSARQSVAYAWVIERGSTGSPEYWTGHHYSSDVRWLSEHSKAIRFARRQDATDVLCFVVREPEARIVEHGWDASPPPSQQLVGIVEEVTHAYGTKVHWKRKMEEGETLYAGPMVGKL